MPELSFIILYIANPAISAAFYSKLLKREAGIATLPTFAGLLLIDGAKLGLWAVGAVKPAAEVIDGGTEVMFKVNDAQEALTMRADCVDRGVPIVLAPTEMNFGLTFVALDPDGHRVHIHAPKAS
jgi:predicted enzyme related to lactoylglutathione lyase